MPVSGYLEAGKTDAVTLAGGVLLFLATLLALFLLIPAVHLAVGPATPANILSIFGLLISALVFGVVGIAVARRWPHWRVYAGVLSWVLIVFGTLSVVSLVSRLDFGGTLVALILIAIGAFPLWAKRHEPKEGVAPPVTSDDAKQRSRPVDISRFIDEREISSFNVRLVLLLFFLFLLEQFELRVPGYALSELAKTLPRSDLPRVFSATLLGVAVGAPVFGYLGDRAGRKTMTVACCLLLGMLTFLTPWMAANLEHLLLARFITGLGLGGVLPNIIALTGEFTPGRLRAGVITSIFALALLVGSILPNLIMVDLIPAYGWGIAFHAGGILALVMAMVVLLWIPESIQFLVLKSRRPIAVARSLTRLGLETGTVPEAVLVFSDDNSPTAGGPKRSYFRLAAITVAFCLVFVTATVGTSFEANWQISLFRSAGPSSTVVQLIAITTLPFQLAGTVGALVTGCLLHRYGFLAVAVLFALAVPMIGIAQYVDVQSTALLVSALCVTHFCMRGAHSALYGISADLYPIWCRAGASGLAIGVGSGAGSIVSAFGVLDPKLLFPGVTVAFVASAAAALALMGMVSVPRPTVQQPAKDE